MVTTPRTGATRAGLLAGSYAFCLLVHAGMQGCAHVAAPQGGPPDSIPPLLIAVEPDSYAVVPGFKDEVRFEFDETISERSTQGTVTIYPLEPRPRVKKGKRALRVRPRDGWVAGRIYHVRVDPGVQDLFNNRIEAPIHYVFSTGMAMPTNLARGLVFDRITGQPLGAGRIDMVLLPDTLLYGSVADSAGEFRIGALPLGEYLAIGFEDVNNNRRADAFDRSDTARVTLGMADTLTLEFQVFRHDTLGPALVEARPIDSVTVELQFDGYLDPEVPLSAENVDVFALADSATVALDTLLHGWQYRPWRDSLAQALAAAADTLELVPPDTVPGETPADTVVPPAPRARPGQQAPGPVPLAEPQQPARLPERRIYLVAREPFAPGLHAVRVRGLLNLSGLEGGGETTFEPVQPEPEEEPPPAEPPPEPPQRRQPPG